MPRQSCHEFRTTSRLNRRDLLQAGALSLLGAGLPRIAGAGDAGSGPVGFGSAKACIFLFMWGGPSQLETFDPKPHAPSEVRGEFNPIDTAAPGVQICELFQNLSQQMDKVAVVRSLNHTDPAHLSSGHATLTGHWAPVINSDAAPPSEKDTPHIGSMMSRLRPIPATLPSFVTMPWLALHPAAPGGRAPGQHGGWLGHKFDPFLVTGDPSKPDWNVPALRLIDGMSAERLQDRRALLGMVDAQRAALDRSAQVVDVAGQQQQAFQLLGSDRTRQAFDLNGEPDAVRDRYGRNLHGQCVLMARRLVERGVPFVSINWHNDGKNFWDTHGNNFNRMKKDLVPPADQALATLLTDLEERGLLDETIVAWVGEFGRNPKIDASNAGRNHWPRCYNGLLAGGGIRGGQVYGSSDAQAAAPKDNPVSPLDFAATIYHALGIPEELMVPDRSSRPQFVYTGHPMMPLFA